MKVRIQFVSATGLYPEQQIEEQSRSVPRNFFVKKFSIEIRPTACYTKINNPALYTLIYHINRSGLRILFPFLIVAFQSIEGWISYVSPEYGHIFISDSYAC